MANIEDLKLEIEKGNLVAAWSIDDVTQWGAIIEQTLEEVDSQVTDLTRYLEEVGTKDIKKTRRRKSFPCQKAGGQTEIRTEVRSAIIWSTYREVSRKGNVRMPKATNVLRTSWNPITGRRSETVRAYIDNVNALLVISGSPPKEIHKFWQTLNYNVQSLETLGKLSGLPKVHGVLDELPSIKADLVNGKPGWKDWGFEELMQ